MATANNCPSCAPCVCAACPQTQPIQTLVTTTPQTVGGTVTTATPLTLITTDTKVSGWLPSWLSPMWSFILMLVTLIVYVKFFNPALLNSLPGFGNGNSY